LLGDDKMQTFIRIIAIWAIGSSFIAFTAMKVGAVDLPATAIVPAPFPAPAPPGFPAPVPPMPSPILPRPGGTGNTPGGTGSALGGAPGGGMGGISGTGIH
jgi:hypothetical protein